MILPDHMIRKMDIFKPYHKGKKRPGIVSFGESSGGYDIRAAREWLIFTNTAGTVIDPKNFDPDVFVKYKGKKCVIPPNSFALTRSMEYVKIPRDCMGIVLGKSTYARMGICANFTPLEPEWEGHITVEISNTTPLPSIVYSGEGVAQVLIFQMAAPCEISYADKKGRYQKQRGITLPCVDGSASPAAKKRKNR